jgi:hypothetical protein
VRPDDGARPLGGLTFWLPFVRLGRRGMMGRLARQRRVFHLTAEAGPAAVSLSHSCKGRHFAAAAGKRGSSYRIRSCVDNSCAERAGLVDSIVSIDLTAARGARLLPRRNTVSCPVTSRCPNAATLNP